MSDGKWCGDDAAGAGEVVEETTGRTIGCMYGAEEAWINAVSAGSGKMGGQFTYPTPQAGVSGQW